MPLRLGCPGENGPVIVIDSFAEFSPVGRPVNVINPKGLKLRVRGCRAPDVWKPVQLALPPLCAAVEQELAKD